MESKSTTYRKITLVLNDLEASWLKALLQNPIHMYKNNESETDKTMRERFWTALDKEGAK